MPSDTSVKLSLLTLNDTNYRLWAIETRNYLIGRQLWPVVSGERAAGDPPSVAWQRDDTLATTAIAALCSLTYKLQISKLRTSKEQWDHLRQTHDDTSPSQVLSLMSEFFTYQAPGKTVNEAAARITEMRATIADMAPHLAPADEHRTLILIQCFADRFQITTELIKQRGELDFSKNLASLREAEASVQQASNLESARSATATSTKKKAKKGRCFNCQKLGHWAKECRSKRGRIMGQSRTTYPPTNPRTKKTIGHNPQRNERGIR